MPQPVFVQPKRLQTARFLRCLAIVTFLAVVPVFAVAQATPPQVPATTADLIKQADGFQQQPNYSKAIEIYRQALASSQTLDNDTRADVFSRIGTAHFILKQYALAIDAFQHAVESKPDFTQAYLSLMNAQFESKQYEGVVKSYQGAQRAAGKELEEAVPMWHLGIAEYNLKHGPEALEAFRRAFHMYPGGIGNNPEAIAVLQQAAQSNPSDFAAQTDLGNVYVHLQEYAKSIPFFQAAARLKPDDADSFNTLAVAYFKNSQFPQALEQLQQAFRLRPDSAAVLYNLAVVYLNSGRLDEADGIQKKLALIDRKMSNAYMDVYYLRTLAERGQAGSQYSLGFNYANGLSGTPLNKEMALKWFRSASDLGNAPATVGVCTLLGEKLDLTDGVISGPAAANPKAPIVPVKGSTADISDAVERCRKSADRGDGQARVNVGILYARGSAGIPPDYPEAYFWLTLYPPGDTLKIFLQKFAARLSQAQRAAVENRRQSWKPVTQ